MTDEGGRWVLVTFDLPERSRAQRLDGGRFRRWLAHEGNRAVHASGFVRYLNPRAKVETETNKVVRALPAAGTVYVVEITESAYRRATLVCDGAADPLDSPPESLTVY